MAKQFTINAPAVRILKTTSLWKSLVPKKPPWGTAYIKWDCRGPETYNNCPVAKYNDGTSWPVEAGHPCIGCSEPNFWDAMTPFYEEI